MDAQANYRREVLKRGRTSSRDRAEAKRQQRARFVERLNELKGDQSWRALGDAVGLPFTTMNSWTLPEKKGKALPQPRMSELRAIAMHFDVTTDWLVGIEGAVKRRGASKPVADLGAELANHVRSVVVERIGAKLGIQRANVVVDADALLLEVERAQLARAVQTFLDQARSNAGARRSVLGKLFEKSLGTKLQRLRGAVHLDETYFDPLPADGGTLRPRNDDTLQLATRDPQQVSIERRLRFELDAADLLSKPSSSLLLNPQRRTE